MPGPAAGDDREAGLAEQLRGLDGGVVVLVRELRPRRAEDRHRRIDLGEMIEAGHELARDPQHAPRLTLQHFLRVGRSRSLRSSSASRGLEGMVAGGVGLAIGVRHALSVFGAGGEDKLAATMKYFLGVDGGASKTAALVTDENSTPLGRGLAGGSNHLRVGIEQATRNIERAVNIALVEAGVAIREIDYAYCGIAGSDHIEHHERVVEALRVFFPRGNFVVDNDARIALTGAVGFGSGIVVIAGTGSVAFGRNESGGEARAGGWGPKIGDEGSGYAIARDGLTAIVRAYDGRGPATKMTDLLCFQFAMCDPGDLPRFVYATTTGDDGSRAI